MDKHIHTFRINILIVFLGTAVVNIFNLLYQLLVAHSLSPADFAAFNSLLSIFMLIASPLATIQPALAKHIAEFKAKRNTRNIYALLDAFFKKTLLLAVVIFLAVYLLAPFILSILRISSSHSGIILAALLALSLISPILLAGLQGLEIFKLLVSISIITGIIKLGLTFFSIRLNLNIECPLLALLGANLSGIIISFFFLRRFLFRKIKHSNVNFLNIISYTVPISASYFCFMSLVNFDMVMVKYFFSPFESGLYSLAQMAGKIFLFLPGAISIVMFPRVAGLNARNMDTRLTLKHSLFYAGLLCCTGALIYNICPVFVLKLIVGKAPAASVLLGRLFSVSMSFFALIFIIITYFLSIKDLRFIGVLILSAILQFSAIVLFHRSIFDIQVILCINSFFLLLASLLLIKFKPQ